MTKAPAKTAAQRKREQRGRDRQAAGWQPRTPTHGTGTAIRAHRERPELHGTLGACEACTAHLAADRAAKAAYQKERRAKISAGQVGV